MRQLRSGRGSRCHAVLLSLLLLLALAACSGGNGDDENDGPDVATTEDGTTTPEPDVQDGEDSVAGQPDQATDPDVCVPDCEGKACGDDSCGGSCGNCFTMEGSLNNDLCQADGTCTVCGCAEGQECGVDPCGSPCGTCGGNWVCNDANTCDPPPVNCFKSGFHSVDDYAKANTDGGGGMSLHYQGVTTETAPFDVLVVDIESAHGGPTGPGTYDLAYDNFEDGGIYAYILKGWNGNGYEYLFAPTEGTIEIKSLSADGGKFEFIFHDAYFEQGTYNGDTNAPEFTPHGDIWCMDGVVVKTDLLVTQPYCVDEGTGFSIGDNIGDFSLQRCDGTWVSLHSMCEAYKAIWIVATAGW